MGKMSELNEYLDLADEKKRLRRETLLKRNAMPYKLRWEKSDGIMQLLYGTELYKDAELILTYVDYQSEVMTLPFIEKALIDGKNVFCPRVFGNEMEFYRINSVGELKEGYKGIYEPVSGERFLDIAVSQKNTSIQKIEASQEIACGIPRPLMLVPGAVFDKRCHRIGYGKGFYDRYLTRLSENGIRLSTIGLGYEEQIINEVPCEIYDVSLDMVLTETAIYVRNL